MASLLGCITKVPNHRHAAYGVAAVQDIAWTGLRSREACRIMQRMLLTKASCVGGMVLLYLLGILKRSRCIPIKDFLMALKFGFHKQQCGTAWDARNRPTSIWIHIGMYNRFNELRAWWPKLQEGTAVVCRSRLKFPSDLYKAGDAAPMTCARVCSVEKLNAEGWQQAVASEQWRCPSCGELSAHCKPCTDSY